VQNNLTEKAYIDKDGIGYFAGGLKFADGTTQTTAASGGGGLSEPLTLTQAMTGTSATFTGTVSASIFSALSSASATLKGLVADGATAVANIIDSANGLANAAAKLLSIRNAGTEKTFFDKDGGMTVLGVASGSYAVTIPSGTRIAPATDNSGNLGWATRRFNGVFTAGIYNANNSFARMSFPSGFATSYTSEVPTGSSDWICHYFQNSTTLGAGESSYKLIAAFAGVNPGGGEKFSIQASGRINQPSTDNTASPGAATANTPLGKSAVASGATSVVITNSTCTATSLVFVTPRTLDSAVKVWAVSAAAGSFTLTLDAAPAAAWAFNWEVRNP
jgi:hypothetical protein